ncbi:MAG TPA: YfhO family protein [Vicinamibacteria bacterium]|nr:YfhO family protein [Vicinamibacteria bacterium]
MSAPALSGAPAAAGPAAAPGRGARAAAVLGLAAMVAFVLRGALAGGVLFRRDVHLVWHPQVEAFVRAVAAGSWPVWDPGPMFGQPLLADPSAMVLYPFTWLNLVLRPWTYYTVFVCAHLLFSALGMRLLARRLELSRGAAFVAAALWTVSGPFLSLLDLWHHFAGAAWMPWVLLAADSALRAPALSRALRWGGAMGAQILAGSADMCAMTGLVALGLLATRADRGDLAGRANRRRLGVAAVAASFALALSAGLWMTALDVAARSDRASLPEQIRTYWSVHPLGLAQTLLAGLWSGLPLSAEWRAALFESREPFLSSLYLGLPALALVGAALAGPRHRVRTLLAVVLIASLLLALGRHAPFYDVLVALLPPLRILRYPTKAMVPAALAWTLLAGIGFDVWARKAPVARRRWALAVLGPLAAALAAATTGATLFAAFPDWAAAKLLSPAALEAERSLSVAAVALGVGALLAVATLGLAAWRARSVRAARVAAVALAALAVADLLAAHRHTQPVAPREFYTHRPPVVEALERIPHGRLYAYDYTRGDAARLRRAGAEGPLARAPEGWPLEAALAMAMQMHLAPATAGRWGLRTAYDIDYRGLYPHDVAQLTLLLRALEGTPAHARLLRLGGVSHVVALHVEGLEDLRPVAEFPGLYPEPTRLFAVPDPRPRTYAVGAARAAAGVDAFRMLVQGDLDPAREVLLSDRPPTAAPAGFQGVSRVVEEHPDRVVLEATLSAGGYVVLLDSFAPGWRARVDGAAVPVVAANLAFRAVEVPAGTHRIEYVYRPPWMLAGLALSAAAALTGLAAALTALRGASARGAS